LVVLVDGVGEDHRQQFGPAGDGRRGVAGFGGFLGPEVDVEGGDLAERGGAEAG
jgi:hypothetical protein